MPRELFGVSVKSELVIRIERYTVDVYIERTYD